MKLLAFLIILLTGNAYADCLVDKISTLEQDVKSVHNKQPMDNFFVWMAEIEKVKADAKNVEGWIDRANDSLAKTKTN